MPLSSEGAKKHGGRWNSKGNGVVYVGDSIALCALELLVHLHQSEILNSYSLCSIEVDVKMVMILDSTDYPEDWRKDPSPTSTADIGDQWLQSGSSLALSVPSTIIPAQSNFLLNPNHEEFDNIKSTIKIEPFIFDDRLVKS